MHATNLPTDDQECFGFDKNTGVPCTRDATEWTPGGQHLCPQCYRNFCDRQQRIQDDYPDSDCAPSWFDPSYAGERWGDDY